MNRQNVVSCKAGIAELDLQIGCNFPQIFYAQKLYRIRTNQLRYLSLCAIMGSKLLLGRQRSAEIAGISECRRGRFDMNLYGSGIPQQLDNTGRGGSANNGIIHHNDAFAFTQSEIAFSLIRTDFSRSHARDSIKVR